MHPADNEHEHDNDAGAASMEMPRYKCHKEVWALEIDTVDTPDFPNISGATLSFKDKGYASVKVGRVMFSRYVPVPGDFYVQYKDGYKSFSPRKEFLDGYTKI